MKKFLPSLALGLLTTVSLMSNSWAQTLCENQVPAFNPSAVTASGSYTSSNPGSNAFDGSHSSMWISALYQSPAWIGYQFPAAKRIDRYTISFANGPSLTTRAPRDFELQGFSDGTWKTLDKQINQTNWLSSEKRTYSVSNAGYYSQYRLLITQDNDSRADIVVVSIAELVLETCSCQQSSDLVPVLSGDSSSILASGVYTSSNPAWKAFDNSLSSMWISALWQTPAWLGYSWSSPQFVDSYALSYANGSIRTRSPKDWVLQGSNGGSWVTLDTRTNQTNWNGSETRYFSVQNPGNYSKYQVLISDDNDTRAGIVVISLSNLSLKGCQMNLWVSPANLYGEWHRDENQSTTDIDHYVPTSIDLGLARFRDHITFSQGGVGQILRLAPNDAHYFVATTWVLQGTKLTVTFTDNKWSTTAGTYDYVYEVQSASAGNLRLKVISKTKR